MRAITRRPVRSIIALCLALILSTPLHAQSIPDVSPGERVRISAVQLPDRTTGTLLRVDGQEVVLERSGYGDTVVVPMAELRHMDVYAGHAPRGATALRYIAVGGLVGGVAGYAIGYVTYEESATGWCLALCNRQDTAVAGAVVLGTLTGVIGGLLGALAPPERWEKTSLPGRLALRPEAGGGLSFSIEVRP